MVIVLCISTVLIVSGIGPFHAYTNSGLTNEVGAWCEVNTVADGSLGTVKGKKLKNCKVRLREGSYDSGWQLGQNWNDATWKRRVLSRTNNPLYTCYANWDWVY